MKLKRKFLAMAFTLLLITTVKAQQAGINWDIRTSAADNAWSCVAYGNSLFVAVSVNGSGNQVMTSPDAINWTTRPTPGGTLGWLGVCFGNGLFVAVAPGDKVMTSTDGFNWVLQNCPSLVWTRVTFANGLFVAVAGNAVSNSVMTSPDGINWTLQTAAVDDTWFSITYGNGLFVAMSTQNIMTSPDGINWTLATIPAITGSWRSVTFGNSMFVAVGYSSDGTGVMTSPDGINWTLQNPGNYSSWTGVAFGDGLFSAIGEAGTAGKRVMTSPDGINWTLRNSAADNAWAAITYANGIFVAVSANGTGNRVMTSGNLIIILPVKLMSFSGRNTNGANLLQWQTSQETDNMQFEIQRSSDGVGFTKQGAVAGANYKNTISNYSFKDASPLFGSNYYRLKQISSNGKFEYSNIVRVEHLKAMPASIYPNPAGDYTTIKISDNYLNSIARLHSADGKLVQAITIKNSLQKINISNLAKGVYTLVFADGVSNTVIKQ